MNNKTTGSTNPAPQVNSSQSAAQMLQGLEKTLSVYFYDKAPRLPENIVQMIVQYGPYVLAISLIFTVPFLLMGILGMIGLSLPFFRSPYMMGYGQMMTYGFFSYIFIGVIALLEVLALPGLFKRQIKSWRFVFWATLVMIVQNIIFLNIPSLIISGGLSLYFLFQIRSKYS